MTMSYASTPRRQTRVLVVEDDPFMRDALVAMLESIPISAAQHGVRGLALHIDCAVSGECAWDLLRAHHFDIAFVDVNLPGITGLDLSWCYQSSVTEGQDSASRSGGPQHTTVMIACTSEIEQQQLYDYGMADVLYKPVAMPALRHMLHKWLPRRHNSGVSLLELESEALCETPSPMKRRGSSGIFSARILHVEDCEVTAMGTQCLFQEMGLWMDLAGDGETAMQILQSNRSYDLILLDVDLPGISGYALTSWYKDYCTRESIVPAAVVAVTADPDFQAAKEFGIDRVLPKPITAACCFDIVREWLRESRQQSENIIESCEARLAEVVLCQQSESCEAEV